MLATVGGADHHDRPTAGLHVGDDLLRDGDAGQEVPGVDTAGVGGPGGGGGRLQLWSELILHPGGLRATVGQEHVVLQTLYSSHLSFVLKSHLLDQK